MALASLRISPAGAAAIRNSGRARTTPPFGGANAQWRRGACSSHPGFTPGSIRREIASRPVWRFFRDDGGWSNAHVGKALLPVALLLATWIRPESAVACAESETDDTHIGADEAEGDDDDEDLDEKEEDCPFCRFFLESPCRGPFRRWHKCVETAAKPTDCMESFRPLKECMDENDMTMYDEQADDDAEVVEEASVTDR